MKSKLILRFLAILLSVILMCSFTYWFIVNVVLEGTKSLDPEVISTDHGAYVYNPETILEDIHSGKSNLYIEIEDELGLNKPKENMIITNFTEDEFYEISRYIVESEMGGDLEEWKLVEIRYSFYNCMNDTVLVSFIYERSFIQDGEKYVNYYYIGLSTYSDVITWYEKIEKRDQTKKAINWEKLIYNAYEAKNIADTNGGSIYSQTPNNQCGDVSINYYGQHSRWYVYYYDNDKGYELFGLEIDPKTGKVKK